MMRALAFTLCLLVSACATARPISPPGIKAFELSLATSGADMMVAWHGGATGHNSIYIQSLDNAGRPRGSPHQITSGERYAYEPDLQLIDSDALIAWYEKDAATGELTAWLSRVDRNGRSIWLRQLSASGGYARNPVVRIAGTEIIAAWIEAVNGETPSIWVTRFNADGAQQGDNIRAGLASPTTWNLNATIDQSGTFYVTYDAKFGTQNNELRLLALKQHDIRDLALSPDDGFASVYPDIAINQYGLAAITWFDTRDGNEEIYLAIMPLTDLLSGAPLSAKRITHTPTSSIGAYLAWNDDCLALAWSDLVETQREIYLQTFVNGQSRSAIQRLTRTPSQSSIPSIRAHGKGFAIAWNEYQTSGTREHRQILTSEAHLSFYSGR